MQRHCPGLAAPLTHNGPSKVKPGARLLHLGRKQNRGCDRAMAGSSDAVYPRLGVVTRHAHGPQPNLTGVLCRKTDSVVPEIEPFQREMLFRRACGRAAAGRRVPIEGEPSHAPNPRAGGSPEPASK